MTTHDDVTYFAALEPEECRNLLESGRIGRVAWSTEEGINVLPVNYRMLDGQIVFHTAEGTVLSKLLAPTPVSFQVDDIDVDAAVGWSILVRGVTSWAQAPAPESWAPSARVGIAISTEWLGGRVISGTPKE